MPQLLSTDYVVKLRQLMASYDDVSFVLDGAFHPQLESAVRRVRQTTAEAADALYALLTQVEKEKENS